MHIRHCMLYEFNLKKTRHNPPNRFARLTVMMLLMFAPVKIGLLDSTLEISTSATKSALEGLSKRMTIILVELLEEDPRQSKRELALELSVSHTTVLNRLR